MTTPTTPANALDVSDIRDEINPGDGSGIQQDVGANTVVRQLTGSSAKSRQGTEILFSDLSNKIGFSEIFTTSTTNTQGGVAVVGAPISAELTLQANSDMFDPLLTWTYSIDSGSDGVTASDITVTKTNNKTAVIKLSSASGTKVANLTVTGVMTVDGHTVNTCTKNVKLTVNAVNTAFQITATPSLVVNATGVSAQTAAVTLKATSNAQLAGTTYRFTPTFSSGTGSITPVTTADSISFTVTAPTPSTNTAIYNVLSEMIYQGKVVATNTSTVDIKAQFIDRQITSLTPAALSNNQFSNSASQYATIDITAVHNSVGPAFPQGTITFTLETTGDTVTQQTISSNTSTKVERISLYHNKDADGFGFKKASVVVVATLRSPTNIIMDQKRSAPIILRAGTYGLSITPPPSNTQSGYSAQTATSSGTATWGAGTFRWTSITRSNPGPKSETDDLPTSSTVNIRATAPSGKDKAAAVVNTATFELVGQLTYDGVEVRTETIRDVLIKAESLPYTYSISASGTSNIQFEALSGTTASLVVTGSKSVGTITWTRDNAATGFSTNSTAANVFVTSQATGTSNNQTTMVTGALYDPSARLIETQSIQNLNIDATTAKLEILGANVAITSDKKTESATGIFDSLAAQGVHSLQFPPAKVSGADLVVTQESPTKITIVATATQSSKSGVYRIVAQSVYRGITRTVTKDVSVSVSALAPTLTATKFPVTYPSYILGIGGINFSGSGGQVTGSSGGYTYVLNSYEDIIVESDYPGTINVDYEIRRVDNRLGGTEVVGPFYNEAANTNAPPAQHPASSNKRRDRVTLKPFIGIFFDYDFTYELYDKPGGKFLRDLRVQGLEIPVPKPGATVVLTQDNITAKAFVVTNKPNNGFGYPEPHPLEVNHQQRVDYTATYSSETAIPTPRFAFATTSDNTAANITVVSNPVNGQANVTIKSVYYDSSANFTGVLPTVTTSSGKVDVSAQLTSTESGVTYSIGSPASASINTSLPMPAGRCYRLSTYSYGPRMYHTRDVFSNSNEQIDYSRIPFANGLNGPETKFLGFHDGSTVYAISNRPLYGSNTRSTTRYYSSTAHRSAHGNETPNVIIPTGYFMIMSFAETGVPAIGAITFIGSDGKSYPCGRLWARSITTQNDTSRDNDAFDWFIYEPPVLPAGVTADYVFISNGGYIEPPPPSQQLLFTAVQPGNALIGQNLNLNIGSVTGGIIEEDLFVDPGNIAGGSGGTTGGGPIGVAGDSQTLLSSDK